MYWQNCETNNSILLQQNGEMEEVSTYKRSEFLHLVPQLTKHIRKYDTDTMPLQTIITKYSDP